MTDHRDERKRLAELAGNGDVNAARCLLAILERANLNPNSAVVDWCVRVLAGEQAATMSERLRVTLGRDRLAPGAWSPWFWQIMEVKERAGPWRVMHKSKRANA